ncbi:uncharacterized protein LOC144125325 [Amblyomma americanum]
MPTASSKKVSKSPDARSHDVIVEQSNFQRLWSRFLERKKGSTKRQGMPEREEQRKGPTQNGRVLTCSTKSCESKLQTTRTASTPPTSPQTRRTDRLATPLRSSATTPEGSPRTLRRNTSYSRTITKTLPLLPNSGRCRGFGVGPFTTVYRNRFGTFTRVTSSPPTRPRLSMSSSPVLLRTTGSRGTFTRGRPTPRGPSQLRLYHIASATASSAAKQRPPVRPRLPPPPVPPPPPPPPPPRPRPTFASPTQSSVAKQVTPVNKYASLSAASTRSGSPVQLTYGSGRTTQRAPSRATSVSLTSLSSRARHLPRSPAPSPTPIRRSETFTRKPASPTPNAASAEPERQAPVQTRARLTRSRTFSKDDRVEIVKRDSSPRVFKPKSPSPAQSPERGSKSPKASSPAPPSAAPPSVPRSPPSARGKLQTTKAKDSKTASRTTGSTRASAEKLSPQAEPQDGEGCEINGSVVDSPIIVIANGSVRRASKAALAKAISNAEITKTECATCNPKVSRSIMVQTTDI